MQKEFEPIPCEGQCPGIGQELLFSHFRRLFSVSGCWREMFSPGVKTELSTFLKCQTHDDKLVSYQSSWWWRWLCSVHRTKWFFSLHWWVPYIQVNQNDCQISNLTKPGEIKQEVAQSQTVLYPAVCTCSYWRIKNGLNSSPRDK
jgi:hypothetical protein